MTAEQLAQQFHETYERLAPQFGYETRKQSAKPWAEVPEQNRELMTAVCAEVLTQAAAQLAEKERESPEATAERQSWITAINVELADLRSRWNAAERRAEAAEQRLQEAQAQIERLTQL